MMKALIRDRYGPPEVLEARDIERPAPQEHEVLVQVHAASINDWDWQMLQRPMLPLGFNRPRVRILGSDVAGRIAAVGSGFNVLRSETRSTVTYLASARAAGADLRSMCVRPKSR
jgi:NADPH:quinone reductase-like Zn-dependent oxidoreductase